MLKFQNQVYRINDYLGWNERRELVLSPHFQRRPVWSPRGKSYLIDTILRGMPLPQFFIREIVRPRERITVREVVDGQQRIRTILEYLNDDFSIMAIHNQEFARRKFSQLPEEVQEEILSFPLSSNILVGADDSDVLKIFSRINSYSVPLNEMEKLNAQYVGVFKRAMDYISKQHLEYWRRNKILTNTEIMRMKEVELTTELVGSMLFGLQNGKTVIKDLFKRFDDEFPMEQFVSDRFGIVLTIVENLLGNNIANTEFRRSPLFYSIFCAVYDIKYGFGVDKDDETSVELNTDMYDEVQMELYKINQTLSGEEEFLQYEAFSDASKSSTDKLPNRRYRHEVLRGIISRCIAHGNH